MHFYRFLFVCTTILLTSIYGCGTYPAKKVQTLLSNQKSLAPPIETLKLPEDRVSLEELLQVPRPAEYQIGIEDVIEISVYNNKDLKRKQAVRPDGKISVPLVGDVQADGITPTELQEVITKELAKYIQNPKVDVVIKKYRSNKIYVLGEVKTPGLLRLGSYIDLMEAISLAGGFTENADLQQALFIRNKKVLPVDFYKLFIMGDLNQNIPISSADAIFIPSITEKRVFVLGEVRNPGMFNLRKDTSLIEAISQAGGFTKDGKRTAVYFVRGNPGNPSLVKKINIDAITKLGQTTLNLPLQAGDIIFIPRSTLADVREVLEVINKVTAGIVFNYPLRRFERIP